MRNLKLDEAERMHELRRYQILDTPIEDEFDVLTALAALTCKTPIAAITLVDQGRQWFKSCTGLGLKETPRDIAFCSYTIQSDTPLFVQDA